MPNVLTDPAREGFLGGDLAWDSDAFAFTALTDAYTFSGAHDYLNDVSTGRLWTSGALTGKSITGGVADAADLLTSALTAGDDIVAGWIFRDTGVASTSLLVAYYDTAADGSPLLMPTNGQPIAIRWNNGPFKLFKI